jgi:hypothetical protein
VLYDALPITDVFERASTDTVLGPMELRGLPTRSFLLLQRDAPR